MGNPYHSGGADGGDGQLLVIGVVLGEQILGPLANVGEEAGSLHGHGGGGGLGKGGRGEAAAEEEGERKERSERFRHFDESTLVLVN
jgi:hypothetical protein